MPLNCAFIPPILIQSKNQDSTLCDQLSILRSPSRPRVTVLSAIVRNFAAVRIAGVPVRAGCPQCEIDCTHSPYIHFASDFTQCFPVLIKK